MLLHERASPTAMPKLLVSIYFLLFSASLYILYENEVRPILYYLVITALAVVILLEILYYGKIINSILILLQIAFFTINIIWGASLNYYFFIGHTDLLGHVWLTLSLLETGHVTEVFDVYQPFPLWHILCVSTYLVADLPLRINQVLCFVSGIIYFFIPFAIYLVTKKIYKNDTVALLSSLIMSFFSTLLMYGMYSIARSAISFFFIILLLLLIDNNVKIKYNLALFITFVIIAYHTVSIAYILAILLLVLVLQRILANGKPGIVTAQYLVLSLGMVAIYWGTFANKMINILIGDILLPSPAGVLTKSVFDAPTSEIFNYIQYSFVIFFVIIGLLILLSDKKANSTVKLFGVVALLLIPITFPGPALLVNKLAANLNLERFEEYTFIFMGIISAIGLASLYYRAKNVSRALLLIIFILWVALSVSNEWVASDNPLVKRPFYTFYLTNDEINSVNFATSVKSGYLMSDYVIIRYLEFSPDEKTSFTLKANQTYNMFLRNNSSDILLIRTGELMKRPLKIFTSTGEHFFSGSGYDYYYNDDKIYLTLAKYDRIFSSNDVDLYI